VVQRQGKIASKYRMSIDRIEIDAEDEFFLKPRPQHTIEFFTMGMLPMITVGYNDSDDLEIIIGRDAITYKFSSGLSLDLPDIEYWENHNYNNTGIVPFSVSMQPFLFFDNHIKLGELKKLKNRLDSFKVKKAGKELSEVQRLGANKGLPENVDSVIGSFLTGKNGSTKAQMNKLKQNSGIQGPRRAGGSRKTRKRSKHLR
jgi:hypothetical protein